MAAVLGSGEAVEKREERKNVVSEITAAREPQRIEYPGLSRIRHPKINMGQTDKSKPIQYGNVGIGCPKRLKADKYGYIRSSI